MACCRCSADNAKPLDLHEVPTHISHQRSHSNMSATNSQKSQSHYADETPPPLKMRITTNNSTASMSMLPEVSHIEMEPKINFDAAVIAAEDNDDDDDGEEPHLQHATAPFVEHGATPPTPHDMHFERMQHEYFLQHHQQQQQHLEVLLQETGPNNLRQRKERMSKKQKEIYVNFLEQNPLMNEHRRSDPLLDRYWIKLADILNSVPQGAVKHVAEWKQTFDNWRYRIYLYARYNSKIIGEAALNPKSFKPLTQTDKRAYSIWIHNPDTAPPDLEKMRNVFVNLEETLQE